MPLPHTTKRELITDIIDDTVMHGRHEVAGGHAERAAITFVYDCIMKLER